MSKEILEELEDWKLEAKLEQSGRYFITPAWWNASREVRSVM